MLKEKQHKLHKKGMHFYVIFDKDVELYEIYTSEKLVA